MALVNCKECGHQISKTANACPSCGAKIKRTSLLTKIVAGFFVFVLLMAIFGRFSNDQKEKAAQELAQRQAEQARRAAMTPEQKAEQAKRDAAKTFAESRKIIEEIEGRFKANTDYLKKYYGTPDKVKQATDDLIKLALVKGLYEKSENKEEKSLSVRATSLISSVGEQQREIYASVLTESFVKNGMDVKISATGAKKDVLRLKFVLMSQPLVYKFQNELKIPEQARSFGFKKVIYTDGYNETWTVDL
jgi:hypothetical protein